MARFSVIPLEKMTAAQRQYHDSLVAKKRRALPAPWALLLHAPVIGERFASIVEYFNSDTAVPHKLKILAILTIARVYTAQFEWYTHERRARAAQLDANVIDAIQNRVRPLFSDPNEALVYDMTTEILNTRSLGSELHARAVSALGEKAVVELIAQIGFYVGVSILLVSFDVEPPEGTALPLAK